MCWKREFRLKIPELRLEFTKPHRNLENPGWEFGFKGNFGTSVLPQLPQSAAGESGDPGMGWDEGALNPIQGHFHYPTFPKPLPRPRSSFPDPSQLS